MEGRLIRQMDKNKDMEFRCGLMVQNTKVNGKITKLKVMEDLS